MIFLIFGTGTCYVAQAELELTILLLQLSEWWNYRQASPYLAYILSFLKEPVLSVRWVNRLWD